MKRAFFLVLIFLLSFSYIGFSNVRTDLSLGLNDTLTIIENKSPVKIVKIKDIDYILRDKIKYKDKDITGEDFYKLISMKTSLSYGIQTYEATNIFDKKMPISNFVGRILKKDKSKETNSMNLTVLLNESYQSPVYKNELIQKQCNEWNNKTEAINYYDCSYNLSVFDHNKTKYRWNEYEIKNQMIKPNEKVRIKVKANWDIKLGDNSRDFLPGVIVPKEYVDNKEIILEAVNMTWFNISWAYKKPINVSTPYDTFTHYPANFSLNLSTEYLAGKVNQTCKDIRFTNSTEDGELDYDVVICDLSNSDIATFSVHLDSVTTSNETIYMYYGNPTAETIEDYVGTYDRQINYDVLDMPFKLGSGSTAWDVSGAGNNGTITDATWISGGGMNFDGDGAYITDLEANSLDIENGLTISALFSTDVGFSSTVCILEKGSAYFLTGFGGDNKMTFLFKEGGSNYNVQSTTTSWTIGQSYLGTGIYSSPVINVSLDGIFQATSSHSGTIDSTGYNLIIGSDEPVGSYWDGTILSVKIYNTSLTPTQISLLYNETKYPPTFSFGAEQTSDSIAPTYSTNSTNSTLAGTSIEHRLKWEDNTALAGYIFSFDNGTGSFTNDTWVEITGTLNWSNVTKLVNSTVGATIQWKVYANDSSDNWNVSDIYSYTTTSEPEDETEESSREGVTNPTMYAPLQQKILDSRSSKYDGMFILFFLSMLHETENVVGLVDQKVDNYFYEDNIEFQPRTLDGKIQKFINEFWFEVKKVGGLVL